MVLHLVLIITPVVVYLLTLFIKKFIKYLLSKQNFRGIGAKLIEEKMKPEILDKTPKPQPNLDLLLPVHRISTDETDVHFHKIGQDSIFTCRMLWSGEKLRKNKFLCQLLIKKISLASFIANQFQNHHKAD